MSGHCYSCASGFGLFNKQLGCKKCGFAFCKKCLTKKALLNDGNKSQVCDKCYDILTGKKLPVNNYSPPDALAKRIAEQQAGTVAFAGGRQSGVSSPQGASSGMSTAGQKYKGLSKEDILLAERLEKLKERSNEASRVPSQVDIESRLANLKDSPGNPPPSEQEMAARLAAIKGQDPNKVNQPFVFRPDRRTQQEQIDSLLEQVHDQVNIDRRTELAHIEGIERRLNNLKEKTSKVPDAGCNNLNKADSTSRSCVMSQLNIHSTNASNGKSQDEQNMSDLSEVDRLMRQAALEAKLDADRAVAGLKKDKELWERCERVKAKSDGNEDVREKGQTSVGGLSDDDSEDEEAASQRIIKQLMEEDQLDEEFSRGSTAVAEPQTVSNKTTAKKPTGKVNKMKDKVDDGDYNDEDELPWCCICNEDASLRCSGCDNDLYCQRCFREGHDRFDMKDGHTAVRYSQNAKKSSRR